MATNLPEKLQTTELSRFALRASQLEKVKPIISYWCQYWMVQQILSKGLHTQDDDCVSYTTKLMDRLEQIKAENTNNDAIQDDLAAQAYVEQFGLETFARADNAIRADKASAQTADTFRAAATFLDLLQIFGQIEPDIAAKSKYAKYHALRIAKAIKAGEDPNLSNPKAPPAPTVEDAMDLDLNNPDVQVTNGEIQTPIIIPGPEYSQAAYAPEVRPESTVSPPVVAPTALDSAAISPQVGQISPEVPSEKNRSNSIGGGYFPAAPPTFTSDNPAPNLPTALEIPSVPSNIPSAPPTDLSQDPSAFYNTFSAPPSAPTSSAYISPPSAPLQPPTVPSIPLVPSAPPIQSPPQPVGYAPPAQAISPPARGYRTDEESVASAQKHARWAVSALTFEDVDTAVKELRIALQSLGAV